MSEESLFFNIIRSSNPKITFKSEIVIGSLKTKSILVLYKEKIIKKIKSVTCLETPQPLFLCQNVFSHVDCRHALRLTDRHDSENIVT